MSYQWTALGIALLVILALSILLLTQYQRVHVMRGRRVTQQARLLEAQALVAALARDNCELRSAVRAEMSHVEQLERKLELLQALLAEGGGAGLGHLEALTGAEMLKEGQISGE
ncbi:MAG: hypothetical protein ACRCTL_16685 [Pseudomonas sp.]